MQTLHVFPTSAAAIFIIMAAAAFFSNSDVIVAADHRMGSVTKYVLASNRLTAIRPYEAENANYSLGCSVTPVTIDGSPSKVMDGIDHGDVLGFYKVNFTEAGFSGVEISYECCDHPEDTGVIQFFAKTLVDNTPFVTFEIHYTAGNYLSQNQFSANLTGVQDVYLKFLATNVVNNMTYYVTKLDWIAFF